MSNEENVSVVNDQTEAVAMATEGLQEAVPVKEASTVLGKFKDVDALARAYESLQAEFTRRSQRLRALEKEAENFKGLEETTGAEKLRRAAKTRREAAKEFDAFVAEVSCSAQKEKPDLLDSPSVGNAEGGGETERERVKARAVSASSVMEEKAPSKVGYGGRCSSAVQSEGEPVSGEELYKRASDNEEVRLRIVGEYLRSLGKNQAPISGGGAGLAVTPPSRARTVGQAGDMALQYFRKPAVD